VTVIDRLPTPFGLVRYGVAPDHPEVKNVVDDFTAVARKAGPRFRYLGNLEMNSATTASSSNQGLEEGSTLADGGGAQLGFGAWAAEAGVAATVSLEELQERFDAVVLAYGADSDRALGIPGEELEGVLPARAFVGWYNGHPDFKHLTRTVTEALSRCPEVVVLGQGNVALDVARILLKATAANGVHYEEDGGGGRTAAQDSAKEVAAALASTDMSSHAVHALRAQLDQRVKKVSVVGRRGPAQASFTIKELRELVKLGKGGSSSSAVAKKAVKKSAAALSAAARVAAVDAADSAVPVCVRVETLSGELALGETAASLAEVESVRPLKRLYSLIKDTVVESAPTVASETPVCSLRFLLVPQAILASDGSDQHQPPTVSSVLFARAALVGEADKQRAVVAENNEGGDKSSGVAESAVELKCGLVVSAIGWRSVAVPGVPFDTAKGVVPTTAGGRVVRGTEEVWPGLYAAGWLRRGPSGIIGTNIADGRDVAAAILHDFSPQAAAAARKERGGRGNGCDALLSLVTARQEEEEAGGVVDWAGHERINVHEMAVGKEKGKPREKLVTVREMLDAAKWVGVE